MRDFPHISSIEKEGNQVSPSVPKDDAPTKRHFYELRARGSKPYENDDDDEANSLHFFLLILVPSKWGSMVSRWDRNS